MRQKGFSQTLKDPHLSLCPMVLLSLNSCYSRVWGSLSNFSFSFLLRLVKIWASLRIRLFLVQFLETAAEKHMTYFSQWLLFFPTPLKKNPTAEECLTRTNFHKTRPIKLNETLRSSHFHAFFFNQMMLISVMMLFTNAVNISKYSVPVAISTQYIFYHLFLVTNWHIFRYYYYYPHSTFYT